MLTVVIRVKKKHKLKDGFIILAQHLLFVIFIISLWSEFRSEYSEQ